MSFTSKIVIVTGSGNGIGRSIAKAYAAAGALVILGEKDKVAGKLTEAEIGQSGAEVMFVETDMRLEADIVRLVNTAIETYGQIDIVINNAGISRWKSPYELRMEEWDDILNTNLRSVFLLSREAARYMRQTGGGSILNIASTRAFMSEPNTEAYAASKGGIVALTHALAASFAPDHIQVNCISPGWIETGDYNLLRNIDHIQHFAQRVGKPEDIAHACLYLTAEENKFVSGTNLTIDGGMTHKMIYEPD